jgi:type II secretion system protein I
MRPADSPTSSEFQAENYSPCGRPDAAFTLMEVMIAMAVFSVVVIAILGMVVQSLNAARRLQKPMPDFSILASTLTLSNVLEEGFESGDFQELGKEYEGYTWERQIIEVGSNGLFQVDFMIFDNRKRGSHEVTESLSILMYKPGGRRRL